MTKTHHIHRNNMEQNRNWIDNLLIFRIYFQNCTVQVNLLFVPVATLYVPVTPRIRSGKSKMFRLFHRSGRFFIRLSEFFTHGFSSKQTVFYSRLGIVQHKSVILSLSKDKIVNQ